LLVFSPKVEEDGGGVGSFAAHTTIVAQFIEMMRL
jgi:hypothetical protein